MKDYLDSFQFLLSLENKKLCREEVKALMATSVSQMPTAVSMFSLITKGLYVNVPVKSKLQHPPPPRA